MPLLEDGQVIEAANVVWATGFRPDHRWIHLPVTGPDGWPRQIRGVVTDVPGLFFIGLPFMYAGASALLGGVGRDAAYLADEMARPGPRPEIAERPGSRHRLLISVATVAAIVAYGARGPRSVKLRL